MTITQCVAWPVKWLWQRWLLANMRPAYTQTHVVDGVRWTLTICTPFGTMTDEARQMADDEHYATRVMSEALSTLPADHDVLTAMEKIKEADRAIIP